MSKLENEIEYHITWARCSPASAVTGAFSYAHIIFVLADPPSWSCLDPGATQCDANVTGGYSDISICTYLLRNMSFFGQAGRASVGEERSSSTHHIRIISIPCLWRIYGFAMM